MKIIRTMTAALIMFILVPISSFALGSSTATAGQYVANNIP